MNQDIKELIDPAKHIVVLQADNPDGDSLGSALALEQILGDMGKEVTLYCGVDIPSYLRYLDGWDRVVKDLPANFDAFLIVDTSADSLFEVLASSGQKPWLKTKPGLVIDHHATESTIDYAKIVYNIPAVATGEIIYELAKTLKWPLNLEAKNMIVSSIMSDSLGLTSEAVTPRSIHIIGELAEGGVSLAELENKRRESGKKTPGILDYKADLIKRIEYHNDGQVATITIPWEEIQKYSQDYNPSMLVLDEMRMVEGVRVAIAYKTYPDGKITAKIRCNYGSTIAQELAEAFGGGGHKFASGFKVQDKREFVEVKKESIALSAKLLDKLNSK